MAPGRPLAEPGYGARPRGHDKAVTGMTQHVLVGIDGSPQSMAAAYWAGEEAMTRGTAVHLLNVWQAPTGDVRFSPDPEGIRLWEESRLGEVAKVLSDRYPALTVTLEQAYGTPVKVLLGAAATADLVVLGSRGFGSVAGFLYGSVGLHVLARADQPVVMVRSAAGRTITGGRIVLGADLDRPCDALVAFAFEEAAARGAPLRVVHVWDEHKEYGYGGPALDPRLGRELREERARKLADLLAPWRARHPGVQALGEVVAGPVAETLLEEGRAADLMIVGRRRRRGPGAVHIGPVAHGIVHHVACPVAVVSHD